MTIEQIINSFGALKVVEKREISETKAEFVIENADLTAWNALLSAILGEAVKPAGVKPSADHSSWAKPHGGIFDTQTLYKKDFDGHYVVAMLWPWGDQAHTTLKLVVVLTGT